MGADFYPNLSSVVVGDLSSSVAAALGTSLAVVDDAAVDALAVEKTAGLAFFFAGAVFQRQKTRGGSCCCRQKVGYNWAVVVDFLLALAVSSCWPSTGLNCCCLSRPYQAHRHQS